MSSIVPAQIRGARGMLGWSMMDLAKAAGVSVVTVRRVEDAGQPRPSLQAAEAICKVFEAHGVEFEAAERGTIGVRFDPHARPRTSAFPRLR